MTKPLQHQQENVKEETGSHDSAIGGSETSPKINRNKSLKKNLKEIYHEFCSNTSIHGFQYFGQQRPRKEILFWIIVFIITLYFCISIIVKVYVKWSETPVIVTFSEKSTPIWNIPFPRVTICPETKRAINRTDPSYFDLLRTLVSYIDNDKGEYYANYSRHEHEETLTLMHICQPGILNFLMFPNNTETDTIDYVENLNNMLTDFQKLFVSCKWFGQYIPCKDLLTKVYTDEGICYTFNSLTAEDLYRDIVVRSKMRVENASKSAETLSWSLEKGYAPGSDLQTYPQRVLSSGATDGFEIVLQSFSHESDFTCTGPTQGYKIMLNSPDDVPSVANHFVRVSMDKEILLAVQPKMITTSADIEAYDPQKRRCFLNKDRQLKFYKIYTQRNCERECVTNFTYHECGCVKFSMPHTADMAICGEDKIGCYAHARERLLRKQFKESLENPGEAIGCNCLPGCTSLDYETEISEASFDLVNTLRALDSYEEYYASYPGGKMSAVLIYFKENEFITSRRSELYGVTELLANFGGVLGLFMGVSLLSVVEIIYHCSLRLWSNVTRNN
ncbi:pickpocket protein 28-like [Musca autumnalis]|uniref:pickpocket protein 28-like n=1 Tax=Musca autumnalis TaxID=221902 RepID=UPI003CEE6240